MKTWQKFATALLGGFFIGSAGGYGLTWQLTRHLPTINDQVVTQLPPQAVITASDNQVLYRNALVAPQAIPANQLPKRLNQALLSIEDRHFYREDGLSYPRLLAAAYHDLTHPHNIYGASTIEQQVVKQLAYQHSWHRGVVQKLREMRLALLLDRHLSKAQVLATYYNHLSFANHIDTMAAAAQWYCGRPVQQLSITQAAMLAGMVQAPSNYNPYLHPRHCQQRRNTVLRAMYANHQLSKAQLQQALRVPLQQDVVDWHSHQQQLQQQQQQLIMYNYAVMAGLQTAKQQHLGANYTVQTTVVPAMQQQLRQIVNNFHRPNDQLQLAVTVMDATNGNVLAQVGGVNVNTAGAFNRAISAQRSSGSTIKPVLDYAGLMKYAGANTQTIVNDSPYTYPGTGIAVHDWDNHYLGAITLRKALVQSRNVPAVQALQKIGFSRGQQLLAPSGYQQPLHASSAIGVNISSQTLASLYTALANGGKLSQANVINAVNGRSQHSQQTQVYCPGIAYMLTNILQGVIAPHQFGQAAQINGVCQAGKTGTVGFASNSAKPTDALKDAWFVGYTPQYVVSVWAGFDNPNGANYLTMKDSDLPCRLYQQIMSMLQHQPNWHDNGWAVPNDVKAIAGGYALKHPQVNLPAPPVHHNPPTPPATARNQQAAQAQVQRKQQQLQSIQQQPVTINAASASTSTMFSATNDTGSTGSDMLQPRTPAGAASNNMFAQQSHPDNMFG